ncbi:BadF-type ATPase [Thalassobacillus cyri]|uniref:BadF-type ATPase n=1 Tax=Thalassobacillus cyri TaxID=571932 RepID=A0A1H4D5S9_9BACI|nr:BadF/BadG/BcrA/BcrD ATPase family protein [Thalassobacillus cyri]SEA67957.1 BadF-type ATPase [Thalassobacillus cyri]
MPSNNRYFIGIDGGGTKTELVIGDETGKVILSKIGASTNLKSRKETQVRNTVHQLLKDAIPTIPEHIFVAAAGGDRREDKHRWKSWIREIVGTDSVITVENDAIAALAGTTFSKQGTVLIAGTGSIIYSFQHGAEPIRTGGWGYLLGDEGSGYDIGKRGLQAVMQAYDGRQGETALTDRILKRYGLKNPEELITFIYEHEYPRQVIASTANDVIAAVSEGDTVAGSIVETAIQELLQLIAAHRKKAQAASPIVLAGGVFQSRYFTELFRNKSDTRFNQKYEFLQAEMPPAVGAYCCALLEAGISVPDTAITTMKESYKQVQSKTKKLGAE